MDFTGRSGRGFLDDDEDDNDVFSRREGSAPRDFSMKVLDEKGGEQQQHLTPRSKHSATEQRRRSKINDRFQMLKDLLPQNDQKRDKASFLLEVIEYIKFLQEKVMRYEAYPGWSQQNAKLTPWKLPRDSMIDQPDVISNGTCAAEYMFSGKFDDNISVVPTMLSSAQNPTESEMNAGVSYEVAELPGLLTKESAMPVSLDCDNMASHCQSEWLRSSGSADCTINSATRNEQEDLIVDEGLLSVSTAYSQELLTTLSHALHSSGIDMSQACINVQINLGRRASSRPTIALAAVNDKDHDPSSSGRAMGHSSVGSNGEESEQAPKRHKPTGSKEA